MLVTVCTSVHMHGTYIAHTLDNQLTINFGDIKLYCYREGRDWWHDRINFVEETNMIPGMCWKIALSV